MKLILQPVKSCYTPGECSGCYYYEHLSKYEDCPADCIKSGKIKYYHYYSREINKNIIVL